MHQIDSPTGLTLNYIGCNQDLSHSTTCQSARKKTAETKKKSIKTNKKALSHAL